MPIFFYEATDQKGKLQKGQLEVANERDVRKFLRTQNLKIKRVYPASIINFGLGDWLISKGILASIPQKKISLFTKQLSTMIGAGVPILQALEILHRSEKNLAFRNSVKNIATDVGKGKTLAEAMQSQKGFDILYCNLVKAGESGGVLDEILKKIAIHMEKQIKTKSQIKSAMIYPSVVSLVGVGVIWGMMVFVVPQMTDMVKSSGQQVPWITQMVVDISHFFGKYTVILLPATIAGLMSMMVYIKTPIGKQVWDRSTMNIPLFGNIIVKANLSSFSNTLATLLTSGVSLVDSLEICISTIDNTCIADDLKMVRKQVIQGKTITEPLQKISYFPEIVTQMIRVGEQTGQVDQMLLKVAEVFEDEVDTLIAGMTKMIEPFVIVILGGIIAVILVAMYLPMFMAAGGNG